MNATEKHYVQLIALHVIFGILIYSVPQLAKVYGFGILLLGLIYIVKNKNRNHEVFIVAAYLVGVEGLLRMTNGNISYEFSKYGVMIFMIIGMYYSGFSKNAMPYWIYLFLLVPGIVIGTQTLSYGASLRTSIAFNISGPACIGISSLYAYNKKISFEMLNKILLYCGLPIVSMAVYLLLYTPNLKDVLVGTGSNFATSGGFGPNQVATILGFGIFVFLNRILLYSETKLLFVLNSVITVFITYRGLITFSRGGIMTGYIIVLILIVMLYSRSKNKNKLKLNYLLVFLGIMLVFTWNLTAVRTDGLIQKRYANQDAQGRVKDSQLTGREEIIGSEIDMFLDSPVFGVGVAKGVEVRQDKTGETIVSHNEISRTFAEHGAVGLAMLLILLFTPIILYYQNKQNIYVFCFVIFWLLTINHAAMRLAIPAFIYALSLLKVQIGEEDIIHRK